MAFKEKIQQAYSESSSYPELVNRLVAIGVQSYTVDVSTGLTLFRFLDGVEGNEEQHWLNRGHVVNRKVEEKFNREATVQAVKNTQQGKTTYPQFMDEIARAGVRFYEATLWGNKRVTYIGAEEEYEELIPNLTP